MYYKVIEQQTNHQKPIMTTTKKYYIRVPAEFSIDGKEYWKELCEVAGAPGAKPLVAKAKTLTAAKQYVDRVFPSHREPEIAVSVDEGSKTVVAKKVNGKWEIVSSD